MSQEQIGDMDNPAAHFALIPHSIFQQVMMVFELLSKTFIKLKEPSQVGGTVSLHLHYASIPHATATGEC